MVKAFGIAGYPAEEVEAPFRRDAQCVQIRRTAPRRHGARHGAHRDVAGRRGNAIREVIMFPMNQRAEDLMMAAPSEVDTAQLRELGLRLIPKDD